MMPIKKTLSAKEKIKSQKKMKCRIIILGGNMKKTPHLKFERLITLSEVAEIVKYIAQFPEA